MATVGGFSDVVISLIARRLCFENNFSDLPTSRNSSEESELFNSTVLRSRAERAIALQNYAF